MILVISDTISHGRVYANALRYFGLLAFQETAPRALAEITPSVSAVLITAPDSLADEKDYVRRIRSYNKEVPIFAIKSSDCDVYDLCIPCDRSPSAVYEAMQEYISRTARAPLGTYKLAGLDVSAARKTSLYSFLDIKFTTTELFILRYLIRSFPIRQTAKDIIKYAYPKNAQSCEAVIRTHISKINHKFYKLTDRYLICSEPGAGYLMDTPIKPEIFCAK